MGYYIGKENFINRMYYILLSLIALTAAYFDLLIVGVVLLLYVEIFLRKDDNKHNYIIFEERGIKILKYGTTWDSYLEWDNIHYAYKWPSSNFTNCFYILSEKPIERKKRNKMVSTKKRNLEDGLVIWINFMDPKSPDVEKIIQSKLSHLEMEERQPWYKYYNEKKQ